MRSLFRRLKARILSRFAPKSRPRSRLRIENLETRTLLSTSSLDGLVAAPASSPDPWVTNPSPFGYSPGQIRHAYGFDQIAFENGAIVGDGTGQTIAVIDAYNDPTIAGDLHTFDQAFHLPDPAFSQIQQYVNGQPPRADAGWSLETALDVEWAHAVAPGARILLVEAASSSYSDLLAAVDYARSAPGVSVVSLSWGGPEFAGEASYDGHFTTPAGHPGVTFVASSGDNGGVVEFPAVSPNVVAVGGTTLHLNGDGTIRSETAWNGSDGGVSAYEPKPAYQAGLTWTGARSSPDVAYDANQATGFAVYDAYGYYGQSGWFELGGTSAGAPQWAGLVAIADQGRALAGAGPLDGASQTLPALYNMPPSYFHDITVGSSANGRNAAGFGYDLVTGRGSPVAPLVVQYLAGIPMGSPAFAGAAAAVWTSAGSTPQTLPEFQLRLPRNPAAAEFILANGGDPGVPWSASPPNSGAGIVVGQLPLPGTGTPSALLAPTGGNTRPIVNRTDVNTEQEAGASPLALVPRTEGYKSAGGEADPGWLGDDLEDALARPVVLPFSPARVAAEEGRQDFASPVAQATDAYFMAAEGVNPEADAFWLAEESSALLPQSPPSMAALAVVLGSYWSANLFEPESRTRRPPLPRREAAFLV